MFSMNNRLRIVAGSVLAGILAGCTGAVPEVNPVDPSFNPSAILNSVSNSAAPATTATTNTSQTDVHTANVIETTDPSEIEQLIHDLFGDDVNFDQPGLGETNPPVNTPPANTPPANTPPAPTPGNPPTAALALTSTAFADGGVIPVAFTGDGDNVSPAVNWTTVPANTKGFVVIMEDTSANWVHWVIYNIPAGTTSLPQGVARTLNPSSPTGAAQGVNSFDGTGYFWSVGYAGPYPPNGDAAHNYRFTLYAIDGNLNLQPGLTANQVSSAISGHVLGQAQLNGTYAR